MKFYLFTDSEDWDRPGGRLWAAGCSHRVTLRDRLYYPCPRILGYQSALVASFLQPLDGWMKTIWPHEGDVPERSQAHMWLCEGKAAKVFYGAVTSFRTATALHREPIPAVTMEQRVRFAILAALNVFDVAEFKQWAEDRLSGSKRAGTSIVHASRAVDQRLSLPSACAALRSMHAAGLYPDLVGPMPDPYGSDEEQWISALAAAEASYRAAALRPMNLALLANEALGKEGLHPGPAQFEEPHLWEAVRKGDIDRVHSILHAEHRHDLIGRGLKARNSVLNTALYRAVWRGDANIVEMLLIAGADANSKVGEGWTQLHVAAQYGHAAVVRLLAKHRADINARNSEGSTPLWLAIEADHPGVVDVLVEYGARIGVDDFLLEKGAQPE